MSIRQNVEIVRENISKAKAKAGVGAQDVAIVCVSKGRSLDEIYQVLDAGVVDIAENKVQEAEGKFAALSQYAKKMGLPFRFHMVGHLQTNKVSKALEMFDLIHSADSLKLSQKLDEASRQRGAKAEILLEVNTSNEKSKFGVAQGDVVGLLKELAKLENIYLRGLMTMAPLVEDKEDARPYFRKLRQLRDEINKIDEPMFRQRIKMDFLSMGMSQDYEVAVEEGANMVRIGTAVFE